MLQLKGYEEPPIKIKKATKQPADRMDCEFKRNQGIEMVRRVARDFEKFYGVKLTQESMLIEMYNKRYGKCLEMTRKK